MAKNNIRLYAEDGKFLRWIDEETAMRMIRTQSGEEAFDARGGAPKKFIGIVALPLFKPSNSDSPTSITKSDVEANVGITRGLPGDPPNENRVKAARSKIASWPYVHDDKATLVTPLGVFCPA